MEPFLVFNGLRPENSVLLGSYGAKSIWEFQKVDFGLPGQHPQGDRSVALPLRNILTHFREHKSLIDPPGSTLMVVIIDPRDSNEDLPHELSVYAARQLAPVVKDSVQFNAISPSNLKPSGGPMKYVQQHTDFVRNALMLTTGFAALAAVIYANKLTIQRSFRRAEYRELGLESFYSRGETAATPQITEDDCDRTRLLAPEGKAFDISSHGGDSHRP
eukprot:Protomagalhaensia_wolfi_Nauph_80__356@NODE_1199_length_1664_cov_18_417846_g920_i0_p1_GENE_NODE_1199_length_1664_cov_18_417846_g920_i0NODE_1199_length_1664_cov_18_417846_g920_i0_p1_ORF_typecomplete_len217_score29_97FTSW_RODA_SPOVE/PF01098_19/0_34_NODE_1199_length_1664_cov_18_417846_g920_i09211571